MLGVQEVGGQVPQSGPNGSLTELSCVDASELNDLNDYLILGTSSTEAHLGIVILLDKATFSHVVESFHGRRFAGVRAMLASGDEMVFISCHMPHKDRPDEEFEVACVELLHILQKYSRYPVLIGGDFNCEYDVIGDSRGSTLQAELCPERVQCFKPDGATWFGRVAQRQYDYFIANPQLCIRLVDSDYGYDVAVVEDSRKQLPSDHELVSCGMLLKDHQSVKKPRPPRRRRRCKKWTVNPSEVKKCAEGSHSDFFSRTVYGQWEVLRDIAASTSIPRQSYKYKDPQHIKDLCRMRRCTEDRAEKTRLTKDILRERMLARSAWWSELEQTAAAGDYTAVQYIKRRSSPKPDYSVLVRDAGSKCGAAELVRKHLAEVFCTAIPPDEEDAIKTSLASMSCLEQDYVPFTHEEILTVIANLKTSKTAGESGVSNEFLKCLAACEQGLDMLQHFLSMMLIEGGSDLNLIKSCIVVLIPKLQTVREAKDVRPICLLETVHKVFNKLLINRLLEVWPRAQYQMGGLPGGQVLDALFTAYSFVERDSLSNQPCIYVSLDISKAFDSVRFLKVIQHLQSITPDSHKSELFRLTEMMMYPKMHFEFQGQTWEWEATTGVQQGGSHSSTVFALYIEAVVANVFHEQPSDVNKYECPGWLFVDDCLVLYGSWQLAHKWFAKLYLELQRVGLHLNLGKTVVMSTPENLRQGALIVPDDSPLKSCKWSDTANYLRKELKHFDVATPGVMDANDSILAFAHRAVFQSLADMQPIIKNINWTCIRVALHMLRTYVHSKWLWISPIVQPLQKYVDQVVTLQNTSLSLALKLYIPSWLHHDAAMPLSVLRKRTAALIWHHERHDSCIQAWIRRKWHYLGHILRMSSSSPPSIALQQGKVGSWKQVRSGPRNMFYTWALKVVKDILQMDASPDWSFLQTLATDRARWRNLQDAVVQLYWQSPKIATKRTEWTVWKHPLIHCTSWAICIYLGLVGDCLVATWLDREHGWQYYSRCYSEHTWHAHIFGILGYVQFCGSWLSFQFLLPGDLFDIHECEMYDCSRSAYRDRIKVVSFQVVPDQWLQTVQHASSAQP